MKKTNRYIFLLIIVLAGKSFGNEWPFKTTDQLSSVFGPRNMGDVEYGETPDPGEDPYDYDSHGGWTALYNS